ncbi:MAG: bifunctional UDP-N-acetylglucosamine diphosphorylase/glucosamine-1-phosphate N-acetyltransferase GlmU [Sedimenticola sp.]
MKLGVVILAAGKGTRMKSALPKVLHSLAGRPLVSHVIGTARELGAEKIAVVYGHGGELVPRSMNDPDLAWVEQAEQLGTGHAVEQALPAMSGMDRVLVLYGDVPLTARSTLSTLIDVASDTELALLTVDLDDPTGYGRIVRDDQGNPVRIVEQKDASEEELGINEVNTGILVADGAKLNAWIDRLENENAQGEFYLTDIVAMAVAEGIEVHSAQPANVHEVMGVNDRVQLAELERHYQRANAERLMREGVTLYDPGRFDLRGSLKAGSDVVIDVNVVIEGDVTLGSNVTVGANTVLRNVTVGDNTVILENCVLEDASVGADSRIGPFSRLRPGARLVGGAHVGNFVEIKNAVVGLGSKVNHLTYVGDAEVGEGVNVGAGTITCNYDGANKHKTVIGDGAFIGSNTALVAPVTVGEGATIGAGSVISKDAPAEKLTVERGRQITLNNWQRPLKKPKK